MDSLLDGIDFSCTVSRAKFEVQLKLSGVGSGLRLKLKGFSQMGVSLNGGTPISHPKMIIFSRKSNGCWVPALEPNGKSR